MKNSLYVIAALLVVIWGIIYWGFNATGAVHIILVPAAFLVIVRLIFNKQLSSKNA